jgi:hypothetical protein
VNRKAFNYFGLAHAQAAFKGNAEEEADDYLIKAPVEGYGFQTYMGINNLDILAADSGGAVDYLLKAVTKMNLDVLKTIFIFRGVEYFVHADAAKRVGGFPAERAGRGFVDHIFIPPK